MKRTKKEAEQTREDILNAAVTVFSEKSVARSTLNDIAKAANVTRGAIYWHFDNKTDIFNALYERLHRPFIDIVLEDLEKNHPEPMEQLQALWTRLFLDMADDEQKRQVLSLFLIKCDYAGELAPYKELHRKRKNESMRLFRRYFEKAQKAGKLSPTANPDLLNLTMSCFMKGILFEYLEDPQDFNIKQNAPELISLFFKSIKNDKI